ncbi:MAG: aminotransferase class IV [Sedimentisphaerales bacterium]|nr:aminotransferase class IV [Sedimentisphaerales bacterium]
MKLAMINDDIMPLEKAQISAHDRCVYFGDGVYEAVRCHEGKLFAMDRHMARLENSLRQMDMLEKVDMEQIRHRVNRALRVSLIHNSMVYFQISRGQALRSHDYSEDWKPNFLLTIRKFSSQHRAVHAITHPDWRWKRCDIKSLNLLANVMAKHAATQAGAYEAILVDDDGWVTEATSSSVLIVKNRMLKTAPLSANILPGITRALLLEWADAIGLVVQEKSFTVADALAADELMITGTGTEVMGITHLDGKKIADGTAGTYTMRFQEKLTEAMSKGI